MKAFVVSVNGQPVCTAGIGPRGVLHVIVDWVRREGEPPDGEFGLSIGGLDTSSEEHVRWAAPDLGVGDEMSVRVVEADAVDNPAHRYKSGSGTG